MKHCTTAADAELLLERYDTFLFDCDGVLWHGNDLIPGVRETLEFLRARNKRLLFVTNNSTKSRAAYAEKFKKLALEASVDEIFGSSYATAYYLKNVEPLAEGKRVYVLGSGGIIEELEALGVPTVKVCSMDEDGEDLSDFSWTDVQPDPSVSAVVIGFDLHFNYKKLAQAHCYLRENKDCRYFATNTDATYPADGRLFPGTGCMVAALTTCVGREPRIFGKPHQPMLDCILDRYHLVPERTCMVGDRLDTDILFGKLGGLGTLLVLTGVTQSAACVLKTPEMTPEYYAESLPAAFAKGM